jgi:RimJ/RimL family protein N-acetyltransferase
MDMDEMLDGYASRGAPLARLASKDWHETPICATDLSLRWSFVDYDGSYDPWELDAVVEIPVVGTLTLRNVRNGDQDNLKQFGERLGATSRSLFSPYPWEAEDLATKAFSVAIERNIARIDATYLVLFKHTPVGHFVLWGLGSRRHSCGLELRIPTLGIAIADKFHRRGIGTMCLQLIKELSRENNVDAIELTTAPHNVRAGRLYQRLGFVDYGTLNIPLGVDPSMSIAECKDVAQWRAERHMYHQIKPTMAKVVTAFLDEKKAATLQYAS